MTICQTGKLSTIEEKRVKNEEGERARERGGGKGRKKKEEESKTREEGPVIGISTSGVLTLQPVDPVGSKGNKQP